MTAIRTIPKPLAEHDEVASYARRGYQLWEHQVGQHGRRCGCLVCADTRQAFGLPPLPAGLPVRGQASITLHADLPARDATGTGCGR